MPKKKEKKKAYPNATIKFSIYIIWPLVRHDEHKNKV